MESLQKLKDEVAGIVEKDIDGDTVEEVVEVFMDVLESKGMTLCYREPSGKKKTVPVGVAGETANK